MKTHWRTDIVRLAVVIGVAGLSGALLNIVRPHGLSLKYEPPTIRAAQASSIRSEPIRLISLAEMRSLLGRPDILILDARPEVFHRAGHIQGAYSFPREEFSTQFPKYEPALRDPHLTGIVIYCSGGECEDSAALAQYLSAKEIGPLAIFTGGWEEWSADESTDAPGK